MRRRTLTLLAGVALIGTALGTATSRAQRPVPDQLAPPEVALPDLAVPSHPAPAPAAPLAEAEADPMQVVESFVARSRKEADDRAQALGREAETLRARLQKVEAALARWQAVANALRDARGLLPEDGPRLEPIDEPKLADPPPVEKRP